MKRLEILPYLLERLRAIFLRKEFLSGMATQINRTRASGRFKTITKFTNLIPNNHCTLTACDFITKKLLRRLL